MLRAGLHLQMLWCMLVAKVLKRYIFVWSFLDVEVNQWEVRKLFHDQCSAIYENDL